MSQRPFKAFARNINRQDARLSRILQSPAGAVHHPQERRLNPRHPFHLERRRDKRTVQQCSVSDGVGICLINADGLGIVQGANLAYRNRGEVILHRSILRHTVTLSDDLSSVMASAVIFDRRQLRLLCISNQKTPRKSVQRSGAVYVPAAPQVDASDRTSMIDAAAAGGEFSVLSGDLPADVASGEAEPGRVIHQPHVSPSGI